ncbi:MAG: YfcC family protein, partial [Bacteroidota bacterium]
MKKFNFNTLVMIFAVIVLVAITTWIVPSGEYKRQIVNGRTLVIPNSFEFIENKPQGIADVLASPFKGFVQAAEIIGFLLMLGGSFSIILKTGAITASIQNLARTFAEKPHLQKYFIPVTMTIFSVAGSSFGMSEEVLLFIPLFIPLALSLGYDSFVGVSIPFLGAAAGFAASVFNPFTVGIAQSIAQIPLYSGMEYRIFVWVLSTTAMTVFVSRYAKKVKNNPSISLMFEQDTERKKTLHLSNSVVEHFTLSRKIILFSFIGALGVLVYGVLEYQWWLSELAALFLALGIFSGIVGKLTATEMTDSFRDGAKDMVGVALVIACARAILVVANDGKVLDVL